MIPFNEWKHNILKILKFISDKNIQFEQWILKKNNINSTDANELMCLLYDDNFFEEFINHNSLSKNESRQLHKFNSMLNKFLDTQPEILEDENIYTHPQWDLIRIEAKNTIDFLKNYKSSKNKG